MLKVRLMGGLGNQIFQYAFARAYQVRNQRDVCLDLTFLNDKTERANLTLRDFELNVLPISLKATSQNPKILKNIFYKIWSKLRSKIFPGFYIQEKSQTYDASYLERKNACLATGYFQSEKYFFSIRDQLLKELDFKATVSAENKSIAHRMSVQNAISLHVRRGDYLTHAANHNVIGACDLNYYKKAIAYIEDKVQNPVFYVFSDDIKWARENLSFKSPVNFIDHNTGKNSYQDMYLMSQCKHNVIANSSFSWWGAWLNQNPNKIVIAPSQWFLSPTMDAKDLYCEGWIRF